MLVALPAAVVMVVPLAINVVVPEGANQLKSVAVPATMVTATLGCLETLAGKMVF